ncbi:sigma-70 family RNA polymerase sigma factor [Halobacillus salinarum]|uniref:RNA polymerase sigma factor n=1 Tax=Halobacillus salinarum TaxID=2932257 RepID=A0ABY4EJT6_9BACI|nr:sigma-70 family RNA polymerase sigma factor [Halobacillus salinarum]UOQ44434.1 sigma-70 family RNA polymerase sigma factor [Halobacillus salinarum]
MIHKQRLQSYPKNKETHLDMDVLIEQWVRDYGHDLKWLAYSYVKDHSIAEDITQEVFIKAYQKYSSFNQNSSVKTWLFKITINLCKDHLKSSYFRRVVKKGADLFRSLPASDESPEQYVIGRSDDEELLNHVLQLENKYREIIVLYYFEEFQIKELAQVLNLSQNTVKTRLRRARQLLQEQLTSEGSSIHE